MKGNGRGKGKARGKARAAGRTSHSEADKALFLELARQQGQRAAAKAAGVHVQTIGNWSKAEQRRRRSRQAPPARVEPPMTLASAHDLRKAFDVRAAVAPPEPATNGNGKHPSGSGSAALDLLHADLTSALERVDRLRAAFRGLVS